MARKTAFFLARWRNRRHLLVGKDSKSVANGRSFREKTFEKLLKTPKKSLKDSCREPMQCDLVFLFALVVGCIACLDEGGAIDMLAGDGCLNCLGAGVDGDNQTFAVGFSHIDERIGSIDRTEHLPVAVIAQGRLAVPQAQQSLGKVEQRVRVVILCFDGETAAFGINRQIKLAGVT